MPMKATNKKGPTQKKRKEKKRKEKKNTLVNLKIK
jgi:hypothetical protein